MKPATSTKTALLIIDVQNGFLHPTHWGTDRSTPQCETNIAKLLTAARALNAKSAGGAGDDSSPVLICHIHHHSIYPDSALHPSATITANGQTLSSVLPQDFVVPRPGETTWLKDVNSGFVGTGLAEHLRAHGVRQLVICGLTTDHCVSTTTRMASNLRVVANLGEGGDRDGKPVLGDEGDIVLVGDACATYAKGGFDAETVHRVSLASLDGEFAEVADAAVVVDAVFS